MADVRKTQNTNVTIRDVARVAGVAIGTVSRVLHANKSVSSDVKRRVLSAIQDLKYEPNQVAQSMRLQATKTVACATRDISIPGFGSLVKSAQDILRSHGYTLLLAITDENMEKEIELLRLFRQRRVDGIVMATSTEEEGDLSKMMRQLQLPFVLLDRDLPADVDAVTIDHRRGIAAATEYLLRLGHENIALVTGRPAMRPSRERIAGFELAFAAAGKRVHPALVSTGGFSSDFGFRAASALIAGSPRPTAIIAGGMGMLSGVLRAITVSGLRIPDDISVIAGADTDLALLATPGMTSIRWSAAEEGRLAVELLLEQITRGPRPAQRVMIGTELVTRASCGPPPTAAGKKRVKKLRR
jgi:LacI family transcriptional regulator